MSWSLRWRLSLMMFLQYAIWGAWEPVLAAYLKDSFHLSGTQISFMMSLVPLACAVSPFIFGQIADRYISTQKILAGLHLLGGIFLFVMSRCTKFVPMYFAMTAYAFLYAPTLVLTNSLTFHHLKNVEREFGPVRVMGTIGWVATSLALTLMRNLQLDITGDLFLVAGVASIIMSACCLLLPHTPPRREAEDAWAIIKALKLLLVPGFPVFLLISFIVATQLQFYYMFTSTFLEHGVGFAKENLSFIMSIGQVAEVFVMLLVLPFFLPRFGVRKTLAIGVLAWVLRYIFFAIGGPKSLIIASLTLHGFCYVFFFTVGQIYVNSLASDDIRASAQALLIIVTLGVGRFIGSLFTERIMKYFTTTVDGVTTTNYTGVFLVPCVLTIICAIAFFRFFVEPKRTYAGQSMMAPDALEEDMENNEENK
ncbi:MAG: nucleoside permease [Planctomycetes bacterium]|nr:nucleoside permease [Planctomycetota bacterium]